MKIGIVKVAVIMLILYIVQFIAAPTIFPIYYPTTNESTGILFGSIAVFSLLGLLFASDKFHHWLICDIPYFLLMYVYSNGAYGIGVVGIPLDGNVLYYDRSASWYLIAFIAAVTLIIQFVFWGIIKASRCIIAFVRKKTQ